MARVLVVIREAQLLACDKKLSLEMLRRQIENQVLGILADINLKIKELVLAKKALEISVGHKQ